MPRKRKEKSKSGDDSDDSELEKTVVDTTNKGEADALKLLSEMIQGIQCEMLNMSKNVQVLKNDIRSEIGHLKTEIKNIKEEKVPLKNQQDINQDVAKQSPQQVNNENTPGPAEGLITIHDTRRMLHDLPRFGGKLEDWPMFIASYDETTKAYKYTDLENSIRLQKVLFGEARDAVEYLLIHPQNVACVIDQLQQRYGRPEKLIQLQIEKLKEIMPMNEHKLGAIVSFATKVKNLVGFIEAAKAEQHMCNPILLAELVNKLPVTKRMEWAQYAMNIKPWPSIKNFSGWIEEQSKLIMSLSNISSSQSARGHDNPKKGVFYASSGNERQQCVMCRNNHNLTECLRYQQMSVNERWRYVKSQRLCFSCLRHGHNVFNCKSRRKCEENGCLRKHHASLHEDDSRQQPARNLNNSNANSSQPVLNFSNDTNESKRRVLLRILPVKLYGPNKTVETYALLDDGSSVTLIDKELAEELELEGKKETLNLNWIRGVVALEQSTSVKLQISGIAKAAKRFYVPNVYTVKDLDLPPQSLNIEELGSRCNYFKNLTVLNYFDVKPKILVGVDNCHLGIQENAARISESGAITVKTPLGWVVYGPVNAKPERGAHMLTISQIEHSELNRVVKDYLTMEEFGTICGEKVIESEDISRANEIMGKTTRRVECGYETGLLWKNENVNLPDSLPLARSRLKTLERKMMRMPQFATQYENKLKEYIEKGYARKLSEEELEERKDNVWYLPHFGVVNPNKPGKIRLVFDAAAKAHGVCLNDALLPGPDINQPLLSVLFKFRQAAIGVCADIREMFHQVRIRKEDQHYQRFLWRGTNSKLPVNTYAMTVMIFGATCSPSLAQYVKNKNAADYEENYPEAVKAIRENHYVDDYVASFASEEEAIRITSEVTNIHAAGGFELRGFVSNATELTRCMNEEQSSEVTQKRMMNKDERVLGMFWKTDSDEFGFRLRFHRTSTEILRYERKPTKRELLSVVMSVFDPFGLLGNIVIYGKLILQETWRSGIEWNEEFPNAIYDKWVKWFKELQLVEKTKVPRCYSDDLLTAKEIQLHVFVDASEVAYAAVAYWRIVDKQDIINLCFIASKTRCAPQKLLSIPRLELQAAVLGIRLKNLIIENHSVRINSFTFWSDSMTVINWVNSNHRQYKPFVAHRVAEILEHSSAKDWKWLPSKLNVADEATRAKYPIDYNPERRWLKGPDFLKEEPPLWPKPSKELTPSRHTEETRAVYRQTVHVIQTKENTSMPDFKRFSKYERLKRATAWMFRFINNCRSMKNPEKLIKGELNVTELQGAEHYLCRIVQQSAFAEEYFALLNKRNINRNSSILALSPYLDEKRVMRAKGRIDLATILPESARRPIILPKEHILTYLIIDYYHRNCHHHNQQLIVCRIRLKFWIPSVRSAAAKISKTCQYCKNTKAKPSQPIMGPLPEDRLTPYVAPFTYTGLDYFGPISVTIGRKREKRWVALFTCLTIRAVHLELATDLTTDACIICLRNFINRRGVPVRIRSDNGTNFVGIEKELRHVTEFFDNDRLQREMSSFGIEWVFNCPANPSSGGCWERLVQSVKKVLSHILQEVSPHPATLYSLLVEAENILNSRPLTHIPIKSEEEEPLTPNHFLLGRINSTQTPAHFEKKLLCSRKQWRIAQQLKNHFWRRWILEYLPDLTRRTKWNRPAEGCQIKEGSVVILVDIDKPRSEWCKARVVKLCPGPDKVIRIAEIRLSNGTTLKRPVNKLAVLDVLCESSGRSIHGGEDVATEQHTA